MPYPRWLVVPFSARRRLDFSRSYCRRHESQRELFRSRVLKGRAQPAQNRFIAYSLGEGSGCFTIGALLDGIRFTGSGAGGTVFGGITHLPIPNQSG